jgi:hypothetical protein
VGVIAGLAAQSQSGRSPLAYQRSRIPASGIVHSLRRDDTDAKQLVNQTAGSRPEQARAPGR